MDSFDSPTGRPPGLCAEPSSSPFGSAVSWVVLVLFCVGYGWIAIAGTGLKLVFQWPGFVLIAAALLLSVFAKRGRGEVSFPCVVLVLAACCYFVVRAIRSPVPTLAYPDIVLVTVCLGVYLLFALVLVDPRQREIFIFLVLALGVLNCVVAFYQKVGDYSYSIIPGRSRNVDPGALPGGLFNIHPHLGGFLVIPAMYGLGLGLFGSRGIYVRMLASFAAVASVSGVVVSASRGGGVGLAIGLPVFAFVGFVVGRRVHPTVFRRAVVAFSVMFVAAALLLAVMMVSALSQRFDGRSGIAQMLVPRGRQYYSQAALDQFAGAPYFGTGAGSYRYEFFKHRPEEMAWHQANPRRAHNDYFQVLAEYGMAGMVLGLAALWPHLFGALRQLLGRGGGRTPVDIGGVALASGGIAVLAAYAVISLVDFNLRLVATAIPVVFSIALFSQRGHSAHSSGVRAGRVLGFAWVGRALPALTGVALLYLAWGNAEADRALEDAHRAMGRGDEAGAISSLHKAIKLRPKHADAHRDLGLVRFLAIDEEVPVALKEQYVENAVEAFEASLELDPFDWWTWAKLAECYELLGWSAETRSGREALWERIEGYLETAISLAPTMYLIHQQVSQHYLNVAYERATRGHVGAALSALKKTLESYDEVVRYYSVGSPHHKHRAIRRSALKLLDVIGVTEQELMGGAQR